MCHHQCFSWLQIPANALLGTIINVSHTHCVPPGSVTTCNCPSHLPTKSDVQVALFAVLIKKKCRLTDSPMHGLPESSCWFPFKVNHCASYIIDKPNLYLAFQLFSNNTSQTSWQFNYVIAPILKILLSPFGNHYMISTIARPHFLCIFFPEIR